MDKPYYSLDTYFKNTFGEKCYKIAIDAGLSCPNRDGTIGVGGCTFCSAGGSGDFAISRKVGSISAQIDAGLSLFHDKKVGRRYVAYFQAYTNTYGKLSFLEQIYREALEHPDIIGVSIATRPDCLGDDVFELLEILKLQYPSKFIWLELGLQTFHDKTAQLIHRGYPLSAFETAVKKLTASSTPVIIHVILGLPGESPEMMYKTIRYVNTFHPFGIKLQLLHILKNTALAQEYGFRLPTNVCGNYFSTVTSEMLHILTLEEYMDILIPCIELLSPDIVIHRVTGDGPKNLLLAPLWSLNKRNVLNTLHRTLKANGAYQGKLFENKEDFYDSRPTHSV